MNGKVAENLKKIKERALAASNGREVHVLAASKQKGSALIREAIDAGVWGCGENRVQELLRKKAEGAYEGARLHFIGNLQSNKVKDIVGECDLIESVSSEKLLRLISNRAEGQGIIQDILLQVNIGKEESKGGFLKEEVPKALELASGLKGIYVRGIMAIPPPLEENAGKSPFFEEMYELFVDSSQKRYNNVSMDFLSMGMSQDFELAIQNGANLVRVGSAIFGERKY
jgi:pyridoxal phosphate enzyme (YggS family)